MSQRIPVKLKAELGESLAGWYRQFGRVTPRRAYHEDEEGGSGSAAAQPLFEEHPWLSEIPIGAPSDLSDLVENNQQTLEEADRRSEELTAELQNRLSMQLNRQHQKRFIYQHLTKPQPY